MSNQISWLDMTASATEPHPARYVGANSGDRATDDFYPTPSGATQALVEAVTFPQNIWEPACGDGAISQVLLNAGYFVESTDLIDRGFGVGGVDFFSERKPPTGCTALITNPPYEIKTTRGKLSVEDWIEHAWKMQGLDMMAMFLKTTALAGKRRSLVLERSNLSWLLQFRGRVTLYKNGVADKGQSTGMMDFAWYVFERGYSGPPRIRWITEQGDADQTSIF